MADRYKLPDALGGGEYEEHRRADGSTEAPTGTVAFLENGCLFTVARVLLTKVEPPLPAEPEPGAYLIGNTVMVHAHYERYNGKQWCAVTAPGVSWTGCEWATWEDWMEFFGPDVSIRRLVPEEPAEPVTLPWEDDGVRVERIVGCGCSGQDDGARLVALSVGDTAVSGILTWNLTEDQAKATAAALLAASRAES